MRGVRKAKISVAKIVYERKYLTVLEYVINVLEWVCILRVRNVNVSTIWKSIGHISTFLYFWELFYQKQSYHSFWQKKKINSKIVVLKISYLKYIIRLIDLSFYYLSSIKIAIYFNEIKIISFGLF